MTCAFLVKEGTAEREERDAVLARVLINDSLFVLCAISLAVCIFKIAKMSSANVYLESKVNTSLVEHRVAECLHLRLFMQHMLLAKATWVAGARTLLLEAPVELQGIVGIVVFI